MDKWDYIELIKTYDNEYGYLLLELMEKNNRNSLREITMLEIKEFYEEIVLKRFVNKKEKDNE